VNVMAYTRGHRGDYDVGSERRGSAGRSQNACRTFAAARAGRAVRATIAAAMAFSALIRPHARPLSRLGFEAARQAGYPVTNDYNGAQTEGFGRSQYTSRNGHRLLQRECLPAAGRTASKFAG